MSAKEGDEVNNPAAVQSARVAAYSTIGVREAATVCILEAFVCERGLALVLVTRLIAGALSPVASQQPKSDNTAQSAQGKEQNPHAAPRTLTDADNNRQITINKGSVLVVCLAANPSTGYSWQVSGDPAPLVLQSTKYESTSANPTRVGNPQVQVMRFKTPSAGTTSLFLEYRRPWEKNVAPARTFRVKVTVQ